MRQNVSPRPTPPSSLVVVGRLGAPFGVRGEIKCRAASFGPQAFRTGATFRLGLQNDAESLRCTGVRNHHETLLLAFEGIGSPEDARRLTNHDLYAIADTVPLGPGEYLDRDLVGCQLYDPAGLPLGRVIDVQHFPTQDCLVIEPHRALVPLIKVFVRGVDIVAKRIDVDLPEGLLDP